MLQKLRSHHIKKFQTLACGLFFCLFSFFSFAQTVDYYLIAGTYTRKTSEGIYVYKFSTLDGSYSPVSIAKNITNPSFLAISPDHQAIYSTGGKNGDSVYAFYFERMSGKLHLLNGQSSEGTGAVHLEVDHTGKWLIVGNYASPSLSVLAIDKNGSLDKAHQTLRLEGRSVNPERQDRPHIHSINISPNNKEVFVPDLGTDKIMTYSLNAVTGHLIPGQPEFTSVAPGSGPRHFTFTPDYRHAYVIQEMDATITGFKYKNGALTAIQTIPTLPLDFTGRKWSADIHISPDGKFLYGSNRAHESLAIFSMDKKSGKLTLVGHQSVNGQTPRNFAIDPTGNFLLVANQDSDNIVIFKRNKKTGLLSPTGNEIKVSMPVCLKFIPIPGIE